MDEMEKYQSGIAARLAFSFYTVALLVWSLINNIKTGNTGWQFPITLVGAAIYYWTHVYFKHKTK